MKRKDFEEAVFASKLNGTAKTICMAYAYYKQYSADDDGAVWPAQATVAEHWGLNKNTVGSYFKALVEGGWFVVTGHTGEFKRTAVVRLEAGRETKALTKRREGRGFASPTD
jgi:pyocin large subunit-like protein